MTLTASRDVPDRNGETGAEPPPEQDLSAALDRLLADAEIWRPRILMSAVQLDIFSALETEPASAARIAERLGTDHAATARLLSALHEMGYLALTADGYRNMAAASAFLTSSSPHYIGSWFKLHDTDWPAWAGLTRSIREGREPAEGSIFHDRERLRTLLLAAHERALLFHLAPTVAAIDLAGVRNLLDLGGGAGSYSLGFCEANPDLVCTIFDLPDAIDIAREIISPYPMRDRIRLVCGDFTRDDLGDSHDVVFLSNVLHGEGPAAALTLLRRIRAALAPGGRVIIRDSFLEEDGTNARGGAVFGMTLMIETLEGRTHRLSDVQAMLREAGFGEIDQPSGQFLVGRVS